MKLILGSKSPRRQALLKQMNYDFEIRTQDADEQFDASLKPEDVAMQICQTKAEALLPTLQKDELLLTADTIVCLENEILTKPENLEHAREMLRKLSGNVHQVMTGILICNQQQTWMDVVTTKVYVKELTNHEIDFYISTYQPFDKAGSYGIQDWFGLIAIDKIEGSYTNVVGLPTQRLHEMFTEIGLLT